MTVEVDPALVGETVLAWVDWLAAAQALASGQLPCSSSEEQLLRIAASLAKGVSVDLCEALSSLDRANLARVATAVLAAGGVEAEGLTGWGVDDLGADYAASSSAVGSVATGVGPDAAAWPAGVVVGVTGWQQAVDPAGVDRCRAGRGE